ncbi:MAG: DUF3524 domain-containing protein [Pirellulaceae bacterium]
MRVLAIEPYFGGSHLAFLMGWQSHSVHDFTIVDLPAFHWKWRMRHSAITLADQVNELASQGEHWDVVFCSDMLNLAEWKGLVDSRIARLPAVLYFHENQLTYPSRQPREWDYHFAFSNFTSAITADQIWYNSQFNEDEFLTELDAFLHRMPDFQPSHHIPLLRDKSTIQPPGVDPVFASRGEDEAEASNTSGDPLVVTWAARWEHDKDPETFFDAVRLAIANGLNLRLRILGESFKSEPPVFEMAKQEFATYIDEFGYAESKSQFVELMQSTDVFVSTAIHEFFGISAVEAALAGAYPLLPRRLAYPEVFELDSHPDRQQFFYDGDAESLALALGRCHDLKKAGRLSSGDLKVRLERYTWPKRTPIMDEAISKLAHR